MTNGHYGWHGKIIVFSPVSRQPAVFPGLEVTIKMITRRRRRKSVVMMREEEEVDIDKSVENDDKEEE